MFPSGDYNNLTNKPFTSLDSNTLEVTDGVLSVIGGGGNVLGNLGVGTTTPDSKLHIYDGEDIFKVSSY